jgi:cell wall hydrolase
MGLPLADAHDLIVAATIATEVPPRAVPAANFTDAMVPIALRAVAEVIRNRARRGTFGGPLPVDVVLAPKQFSAVCREDYWREAIAGRWVPMHLVRALDAWRGLRNQPVGPDVLGPDATHYYSPVSMIPQWSAPAWAARMTEIVVPQIDPKSFRWYKA